MPKISTDNELTLEIFASKSDQRSSAKNGSFRLFGYMYETLLQRVQENTLVTPKHLTCFKKNPILLK
jgi:hypothetical protein